MTPDSPIWPPRLVTFTGPPGAGKTTLARGLAATLVQRSVPVEYLPEDALFWDERLSTLASAFVDKHFPDADQLLAAWQLVVGDELRRWVICDGSWVHLAEDLPWAQASRDALVEYTARLDAAASHLDPITFALIAPVHVTMARAVDRSGDAWVRSQIESFRRLPALAASPADPADRVVQRWSERVRGVMTDAGASVAELDASVDAASVLESALSTLLVAHGA